MSPEDDRKDDPNAADGAPSAPQAASASPAAVDPESAVPDFAALLPAVVAAREQEAATRRHQRRQRRTRSGRPARRGGRFRTRRPLALAGAGVLGLGMAVAAAFLLGRYHDVPGVGSAPAVTAATSGAATSGAAGAGPASALDRRGRREVERLLAALKLPVGPVDGHIDSRAQAAIRSYRQMQGLPPEPATATRALLEDLRQVVAFMADPVAPAR